MWGVVAVFLNLTAAGPQGGAEFISDAGRFDDKASCEAKIAETVPDHISEAHQKLYKEGKVLYVCLNGIQK